MTDLPDEAVEAAYRAYCEARKGKPLAPGEYEATYSRVEAAWMRAALTAAVPHIAAQTTADLRTGIEALAGEMRADIARYLSTRGARITGETLAHYAAALDALLGGA